jgi:hypothetical protein
MILKPHRISKTDNEGRSQRRAPSLPRVPAQRDTCAVLRARMLLRNLADALGLSMLSAVMMIGVRNVSCCAG